MTLPAQTRPLRIVHLLNDVEELGNGINNLCVDLACAQALMGHDVIVVSRGGGLEAVLSRNGVRHERLQVQRKPGPLLGAVRQFRRVLSSQQADVVHTHTATAVVLARAARVLGPSPVHVTTAHTDFRRGSLLLRLADRVIALSRPGQAALKALGVPERKLRRVRNGTLGGARQLGLPPVPPKELNHPAILTIGGLYRRKGIADLIDAMEILLGSVPDAHLYLVGAGPDEAEFRARATRRGVEHRVVFEGYQRDPSPWLTACDVFTLASHREPAGLVLIEARGAGCAIVASEVDGIAEMLDDGRAGVLVPPRDPSALAEALGRLLRDPEALELARRRAQEGVDDLRVERMARETEAVYREALLAR